MLTHELFRYSNDGSVLNVVVSFGNSEIQILVLLHVSCPCVDTQTAFSKTLSRVKMFENAVFVTGENKGFLFCLCFQDDGPEVHSYFSWADSRVIAYKVHVSKILNRIFEFECNVM